MNIFKYFFPSKSFPLSTISVPLIFIRSFFLPQISPATAINKVLILQSRNRNIQWFIHALAWFYKIYFDVCYLPSYPYKRRYGFPTLTAIINKNIWNERLQIHQHPILKNHWYPKIPQIHLEIIRKHSNYSYHSK